MKVTVYQPMVVHIMTWFNMCKFWGEPSNVGAGWGCACGLDIWRFTVRVSNQPKVCESLHSEVCKVNPFVGVSVKPYTCSLYTNIDQDGPVLHKHTHTHIHTYTHTHTVWQSRHMLYLTAVCSWLWCFSLYTMSRWPHFLHILQVKMHVWRASNTLQSHRWFHTMAD